MDVLQQIERVQEEELNAKPNRYIASVLPLVAAVFAVCMFLNELDVYEVSKPLMRFCFLFSLCNAGFSLTILHKPVIQKRRSTKYILLGCMLVQTQLLIMFLNVYVTLVYLLPLFLFLLYHSRRVTGIAILGTLSISLEAPVLAFLLQTYNIKYLTGYLSTVCRVTITGLESSSLSIAASLHNILLYLALPQTLILCLFCAIAWLITKDNADTFLERLKVIRLSTSLKNQVDSMVALQDQVLLAVSDFVDSRDSITGSHIRRVSEVVKIMADRMVELGINPHYAKLMVKAAPMHDIGKIAISDGILRKPGPLTEEELAAMRQHPIHSVELIEHSLTGIENDDFLTVAKNIARYHHEKMDGTGYPDGISGKSIPLEARVVAIADVYDSLVNERSYKKAVSFEEAFRIIEDGMGTHFDPELNRPFTDCREAIEAYYRSLQQK